MARVAFGLRAHSGWAALVALSEDGDGPLLVDRRRAHARAREALAAARTAREGAGDAVVACALLEGRAFPGWSVAEILAVHFRMHQAEGELFREALRAAARGLGLPVIGIREKELEVRAGEAVSGSPAEREQRLREAGKRAGPPWARDQKQAALAAWIALRSVAR